MCPLFKVFKPDKTLVSIFCSDRDAKFGGVDDNIRVPAHGTDR